MSDLTFSKNDFDINKINSIIGEYCIQNGVSEEKTLNIELVCEEFLSNILFPNYDNETEFSVSKEDEGIILSFEYKGENYLNKINDETILSLKILKNKTKGIITENTEGKTNIKFII